MPTPRVKPIREPSAVRDGLSSRLVLHQTIVVERLRDAVVKAHHAGTEEALTQALVEVRRTAEWGLRIIRTG